MCNLIIANKTQYLFKTINSDEEHLSYKNEAVYNHREQSSQCDL